MIRATITFTPDQVNRARPGQYGVWRIVQCERLFDGFPHQNKQKIEVVDWWLEKRGHDPVRVRALRMFVERPYHRGCMVDPRRLMMNFMYPLQFFPKGFNGGEDRIHA